jgi:hypothetical protein
MYVNDELHVRKANTIGLPSARLLVNFDDIKMRTWFPVAKCHVIQQFTVGSSRALGISSLFTSRAAFLVTKQFGTNLSRNNLRATI